MGNRINLVSLYEELAEDQMLHVGLVWKNNMYTVSPSLPVESKYMYKVKSWLLDKLFNNEY